MSARVELPKFEQQTDETPRTREILDIIVPGVSHIDITCDHKLDVLKRKGQIFVKKMKKQIELRDGEDKHVDSAVAVTTSSRGAKAFFGIGVAGATVAGFGGAELYKYRNRKKRSTTKKSLLYYISSMISYFSAAILGIVQGVTELFPISSLGHSVIFPRLLGLNINQQDPYFLIFLVATHTATALVLFGFFWSDWMKIIAGFFRSLKNREINETDPYAKLAWLLVVATVPAGIFGLLFEDVLKNLFASPQIVAEVLILNGIMLYGAEMLRRKSNHNQNDTTHNDKRIAKLTWMQTIKIGLLQCLALIPGFSRTGSTITGGLLAGLNHEDAARYSFLLATPIIGAASILKLPELEAQNRNRPLGPLLFGALCSGIAAYISVKFLTKYFESKKLSPFAFYCVVTGILASLLFLVRG